MFTGKDFPAAGFLSTQVRLVVPSGGVVPPSPLPGATCWVDRDPDDPDKLFVRVSVPIEAAREQSLPTVITQGSLIDVICSEGGQRHVFHRCQVLAAHAGLHKIPSLNTPASGSAHVDFWIRAVAEGFDRQA